LTRTGKIDPVFEKYHRKYGTSSRENGGKANYFVKEIPSSDTKL
jgi:hypothetical protein